MTNACPNLPPPARRSFLSRMAGRGAALAMLASLAACDALTRCSAPAPIDRADLATRHATPLSPPEAPLAVYHLGHSLVGRDMPAMLGQLADAALAPAGTGTGTGTATGGHRHDSQLGWGVTLKEHWDPALPIRGFEVENAHPRFRPAREALASGAYDALVVTEMVEIRDAIRHFDSARHLARWAALGRAARPDLRVYLSETWHRRDDPEGWLERITLDRSRYWEDALLRPAMRAGGILSPLNRMPRAGAGTIHVIPAGQALTAVVRLIEAEDGGIGGLSRREQLFSTDEAGATDMIHLNDIGAYLVALTHFAVLYHRDPLGLPHRLMRADGTPADAPSAEAARMMQQTVWQIVRADPMTGVAP